MVLVLMLRYSLTRIRNLGLSTILPLDHHVYLHKLTGVVILVLAWIHTLSHLINFGVNVQPDPVKFVQLNNDYWVIQVRSLTQFHSVDFSLSTSSVKKCVFNKRTMEVCVSCC